MNSKLVESLAEIIKSLDPEETVLLNQKLNHTSGQQISQSDEESNNKKQPFSETANHEEWEKALQEWAESHPKNTPLLSDEAVSRRGIYQENHG